MIWRPISTAPKDKHVLLFAVMRPFPGIKVKGPHIVTGYFDEIDSAWCGTGATAAGPFYDPTHWMPLPDPPPIDAL